MTRPGTYQVLQEQGDFDGDVADCTSKHAWLCWSGPNCEMWSLQSIHGNTSAFMLIAEFQALHLVENVTIEYSLFLLLLAESFNSSPYRLE